MRSSLPLLLPALACLAQADSGNLYIYDSHLQSASPASTTVSPETARLILASRLGLDQFHDLGHAQDDTIQAINQLSPDQHLFPTSNTDKSVALILGQAVNQKDVLANTASHHVHTVQISDMPSVASTENLVLDLASQSGISASGDRTYMLGRLQDQFMAQTNGPVFRVAKDDNDFMLALDTLLRQDYIVLALTVPNDTTSKHTFGKYDAPAKHSKRVFVEAPLITESRPAQAPKLMATMKPSANYTGPLKGILPQCFSSLSACQALTRNCTGNGACTLKYTDKDARPEAPCYSCACTPTIVTNRDGTHKTTRWGGPACQKKDVVMPFWLLAGFSVFMVSLISWAIGMLLTMGNEELPSVIGAGVSGPRAK